MTRLTQKYETVEEIKSDDRIIYISKDYFNKKKVFIEIYKEISASDWNAGGKVNEDLRKLRQANKIDEYFYTDNKELKTKVFYKIYNKNPLDISIEKENIDEESTLLNNADDIVYKPIEIKTQKKNVRNLERIMVCEKCKTEMKLRNFNSLTNVGFCEECNAEHKTIFEEKDNKKEASQRSRYVKVSKTKDKLLIEITKSKIGMILILMLIIPIAAFQLSDVDFLLESFEIYLALGVVFVLVIMILDKHHIEIRDGVLMTYSKPFASTKPKRYNIKDIEQLYVKKKLSEGAHNKTVVRFINGRRSESEYYQEAEPDTYHLILILKNKGEASIFESLNSADALYLEKTIEKYLEIKDIDVYKEI